MSARDYDLAVHGVVGARGLIASQRVLERKKDLALANRRVSWSSLAANCGVWPA